MSYCCSILIAIHEKVKPNSKFLTTTIQEREKTGTIYTVMNQAAAKSVNKPDKNLNSAFDNLSIKKLPDGSLAL